MKPTRTCVGRIDFIKISVVVVVRLTVSGLIVELLAEVLGSCHRQVESHPFERSALINKLRAFCVDLATPTGDITNGADAPHDMTSGTPTARAERTDSSRSDR